MIKANETHKAQCPTCGSMFIYRDSDLLAEKGFPYLLCLYCDAHITGENLQIQEETLK